MGFHGPSVYDMLDAGRPRGEGPNTPLLLVVIVFALYVMWLGSMP